MPQSAQPTATSTGYMLVDVDLRDLHTHQLVRSNVQIDRGPAEPVIYLMRTTHITHQEPNQKTFTITVMATGYELFSLQVTGRGRYDKSISKDFLLMPIQKPKPYQTT